MLNQHNDKLKGPTEYEMDILRKKSGQNDHTQSY